MAYGLPERGQHDYDDELNNSMEYVRGLAEAATSNSSNAVSTSNYARQLAEQVVDFTIGATDDQMATIDADTDSAFRQQQAARYNRKFQISVADYDTPALALAASSSGDVVYMPKGTYTISSPLAVPAGVELHLAPGAVISNTDATKSAVTLAAGSALRGGTITSPSSWDGTTGGVWTMAVIYITGSGAVVEGVTLNNVPHRGIGLKNVDNVMVRGNTIVGNYPAGQWTGTETSHFAIAIDPSGSADEGCILIEGNIIKSCVQGVYVGNFGTGTGAALIVADNVFSDCWNHGIYSRNGDGYSVTGNSFKRCQKAITMDGTALTITGNAVYTAQTGDARDEAGIHIRNATDCVVTGNTLVGDSTSDNIGISLDNTNGGTEISRNIVANNVIRLASTATAQSAIRVGNSSVTTTCRDNLIEGNVVKAPGLVGDGVIFLTVASGSFGTFNTVRGNTVIGTGAASTVVLVNQKYALVTDNTIRNEYDAPGATTIIQIRLDSTLDSVVMNNVLANEAAWGANVALTAVREFNTADRNVLGPNLVKHDTTKLTTSIALTKLGASSLYALLSQVDTLTIGDSASTTAQLTTNGANGAARGIRWQTAGVNRWLLQTQVSETGSSNVGSDLGFLSRDDAGSAIGTALTLSRRRLSATFGAWLTPGKYATASRPAAATAAQGALAYDTDLNKPIWTDGSTWSVGAFTLSGTATLDFASIAAGATAELTITVTGAATGDSVHLGPPSGLEAGLIPSGRVSATNTVTIRLYNTTAGAIDPASATWRATIVR